MAAPAETRTRWGEVRALSEDELGAPERMDADNPPLDAARMAGMVRVPRAKIIRRALRLTQEEFSVRYRILLGTLRDWEQNRTVPDQAASAYLCVIAKEPETVARALGSRSAA